MSKGKIGTTKMHMWIVHELLKRFHKIIFLKGFLKKILSPTFICWWPCSTLDADMKHGKSIRGLSRVVVANFTTFYQTVLAAALETLVTRRRTGIVIRKCTNTMWPLLISTTPAFTSNYTYDIVDWIGIIFLHHS